MSEKPTIVLVHGAFADASGWAAVYTSLRASGYSVEAPVNTLRGIATDADYVRSFLSTIPGAVVLVGHSYGGCVITNASTGSTQVKALVYINAYAPDEGETLRQFGALGGGTSEVTEHVVVRPYPDAPEGDGDGYIDPAYFHELFCADLPADVADFMAHSQRPLALQALVTPSGVPGWETIPSFVLVGTNDKTIPPQAERASAERMNAVETLEIASSHVSMISHPDAVAELIARAAES
jgi:pimeloyl-ACP methyl ester carboxylesterase